MTILGRFIFGLLFGIVALLGIGIVGFVTSSLAFITCGLALIVATLFPYPIDEIADLALSHLDAYTRNPWCTIPLLMTMGSVGVWVMVKEVNEEGRLQAQHLYKEHCSELIEVEAAYLDLLTRKAPWCVHERSLEA